MIGYNSIREIHVGFAMAVHMQLLGILVIMMRRVRGVFNLDHFAKLEFKMKTKLSNLR